MPPDNPLLGEHVLVSPHRAKRPWQGQVEEPQKADQPTYDPTCYLCPGNARTSGDKNPQYTSVHTFANDFAAVLGGPLPVDRAEGSTQTVQRHPLFQIEPVIGACDVVIFHPHHDKTLAKLGTDDILKVVEEWCSIYLVRGSQPEIQHVQIFEVGFHRYPSNKVLNVGGRIKAR